MIENSTAVLRSRVGALPVLGGRVVHFVEEFEEGGVRDDGGVEGHLEGFGVCFPQEQDVSIYIYIYHLSKRDIEGLAKIYTYVPYALYKQPDTPGY